MITSLSPYELMDYTSRQLNNFYPDNQPVNLRDHQTQVQQALQRLEHCFLQCSLKHYFDGEQSHFNHLYSDHYVMYVWYLANTLWKERADRNLCNKLYYLNKSLHGIDCMFDTQLPDIFLIFHGVGTMLGKATYSDYFVVLQGCTVGMNRGRYPVLGKGVALTAHSSLIGDCQVGNLVTIANHTSITDTNFPDNTVVFTNRQGAIDTKPSQRSYAQSFFNRPIDPL